MATMELVEPEIEQKERLTNQSKIYHLSPRVLQSIEIALQQVRDGQTIPGDVVRKEIDEWLGSKTLFSPYFS